MANELSIVLQTKLDAQGATNDFNTIKKTLENDAIKLKVDLANAKQQIASLSQGNKQQIKIEATLLKGTSTSNIKSGIDAIRASVESKPIKIPLDVNLKLSERNIKSAIKSIESTLSKTKININANVGNGGNGEKGSGGGSKSKSKGISLTHVSPKYSEAFKSGLKTYSKDLRASGSEIAETKIRYDTRTKEYKAIIKYTDAVGKATSALMLYDKERDKYYLQETSVSKNFKGERDAIEGSKNYLQQQRNALANLQSKAFNQKNPLTGDFADTARSSIDALNSKLNEASKILERGKNISKDMKREISELYSTANISVKEQQSAQYQGDKLAAKDVSYKKSQAVLDLDTYAEKIKKTSQYTKEFESQIQTLKDELNSNVSNQDQFTKWNQNFETLKKNTQLEAERAKTEEKINREKQLARDGLFDEKGASKYWQGRFSDAINSIGSTPDGVKKLNELYSEQVEAGLKAQQAASKNSKFESDKTVAGNNLDTRIIKLQELGAYTDEVKEKYETLKQELESITTPEGMVSWKQLLKETESETNKVIEETRSLNNGLQSVADKKAKDSKLATDKTVAENNLDTRVTKLQELGVYTDDIKGKYEDLKAMLSSITTPEGMVSWKQLLKEIDSETNSVIEKTKALNNSVQSKASAKATEVQSKQINEVDKMLGYEALQGSTSGVAGIRETLNALKTGYSEVVSGLSADNISSESYDALIAKLKTLDEQFSKVRASANKFSGDMGSQQWLDKQDSNIEKLKNDFSMMKENWSKAMGVPELRSQIDAFEKVLADVDAQNFPNVRAAFLSLKSNIRAAGADCKSFGGQLKDIIKSATGLVSVASVFALVKKNISEVVQNIKQIDAAMFEFRKITNLSESGYDEFLKGAAKTAKEIGTNLVDMISGSADFKKLGYNVQDAQNLAKSANILYKVGDGFNNIGEATDAVIASMKAYQLETNDVMSIVDKLNNVSNETSINTAGLAEAITRSASALKMGGLDLDRSLALIVAGNETVRDAGTVGNALKSLSARIRGSKLEVKELGDEEDEFVNSTSKMRDTVKTLSGVDIMKNGSEYKDLFQILKEISAVYDNISDIDRANLMETLFGKQRSTVGASILQNFDQAERALDAAQNSTGSAMSEHERWMQSIEASEQRAQAAFQEFSNAIMSSDLIKFYYDAKTGILGFLTEITDKVGGLATIAPIAAGLLSGWQNLGISNENMPYPTILCAVA